MTVSEITIPAFAADTLGESLTIQAPTEWHPRIAALASRTCYGPDYSRSVVSHLRDVDRLTRSGYSALAYDHLTRAETIAARR